MYLLKQNNYKWKPSVGLSTDPNSTLSQIKECKNSKLKIPNVKVLIAIVWETAASTGYKQTTLLINT